MVEPVPAVNSDPAFPDQDPNVPGVNNDATSLTVKDGATAGTSIGDPVSATDADNDPLLYSMGVADNDLTNTTFEAKTVAFGGTDYVSTADDPGYFDIDPTTGQISVKNADAADYESTQAATDKAYVVTVTATDPSGSFATIDVIIVVDDVDEAPEFGDPVLTRHPDSGNPTNLISISVVEDTQIGVGETPAGVTYLAIDPEATADSTTVTYSKEGADADKFAIDGTTGVLTFPGTTATDADYFRPDFENPADDNKDNKYEVTVVATASDDSTPPVASKALGKRAVTVTVTNGADLGTVTLSQLQSYVGAPVTAVLNDQDGGVSGTTWQWYTGEGYSD